MVFGGWGHVFLHLNVLGCDAYVWKLGLIAGLGEVLLDNISLMSWY
jgi:hypothetical protein